MCVLHQLWPCPLFPQTLVESGQALTRYFYSSFFHRPNADNIVSSIKEVIGDLQAVKMIHLGMDGPKTNHLVFEKIQGQRKEADHPPLENLGSCRLHVVAGALQFQNVLKFPETLEFRLS